MSTQELLTLSADQVERAYAALPSLPSLPATGGTVILYALLGLPLACVAAQALWSRLRFDLSQAWRLAGPKWAAACALTALAQLVVLGLYATAAGSLVNALAPAADGWWSQPALVAQVSEWLFSAGSPVAWLLAGPFAMLLLALLCHALSTVLHRLCMLPVRRALKVREAELLTHIEAQQEASANNGRNTLRYW